MSAPTPGAAVRDPGVGERAGGQHPDVSAQPLSPIPGHERPTSMSDATVDALGKLSEALEVVEHARGHLYAFHRLSGTADRTLGEAIGLLGEAGHDGVASDLVRELQGRNVLPGRWTFQVVEEYDDGYYATFKDLERRIRDDLAGGTRHIYEAEMKAREITPGHPGHEPAPAPDG